MAYTFEDKYTEISTEVERYRSKWDQRVEDSLMDFDDASQIMLTHIFTKWELWNQETPLKEWLRKIIQNQLCGFIRAYCQQKL